MGCSDPEQPECHQADGGTPVTPDCPDVFLSCEGQEQHHQAAPEHTHATEPLRRGGSIVEDDVAADAADPPHAGADTRLDGGA